MTDLIAAKYRSLLQQVSRNRFRRQDIFDLFLLLEKFNDFDEVEIGKIHTSPLLKSKARGINATKESIDDPELKQRAKHGYETLSSEIEGALPDFDKSFDAVSKFYRSLPW